MRMWRLLTVILRMWYVLFPNSFLYYLSFFLLNANLLLIL